MKTNKETFKQHLANAYTRLFKEDKEYQYSASINTPEGLANKMIEGLSKGSANVNGSGIRSACKAVEIKQTVKSIKEYLNS